MVVLCYEHGVKSHTENTEICQEAEQKVGILTDKKLMELMVSQFV